MLVGTNKRKRWWLWALGLVFVVGAGLFGYARFVEPTWIETTHHEIVFADALQEPIKIAHLTDLHIGHFGTREQKVLDLLEQEKPDLVVITGDWLSDAGTPEDRRRFFSQLHARYGVYVVPGNWEGSYPRTPAREKLWGLEGNNQVHLLQDQRVTPVPGLTLVGFDYGSHAFDQELGTPGATCVALFHEPVVWDGLQQRCALSLAGHTHGGQVRLPGLPPLVLPPGSGSYIAGWYQKDSARLYVSRGVGTSRYPARLFCRPEVAFLTLMPRHLVTLGDIHTADVTWEHLAYDPAQPLLSRVQIKVTQALQQHQTPLLFLGASWCDSCKSFKRVRQHPLVAAALRGTYVVELDLEEWNGARYAEVRALGGFPAEVRLPALQVLDTTGHFTGHAIDGDAWDNTPAIMAAALRVFLGALPSKPFVPPQ